MHTSNELPAEFEQRRTRFLARVLPLLGLLLLVGLRAAAVSAALRDPTLGVMRDSWDYLSLAENWFGVSSPHPPAEPGADLFRAPGYPAFLALILGLSSGRLVVVYCAQIALSLLSAYLLCRLTVPLAGRGAGWAAACVYLLDPGTVFLSAEVLSEVLFAAGLTLALYLSARTARHGSRAWLLGLLLGALALVRPIGVYLVVLWAGWLAASIWKRDGWKRGLVTGGTVLVVAVLTLLPWYVRNYRVHGEFVLSSVGGITVRSYHLALVLVEAEGMPWEEAKQVVAASGSPAAVAWDLFRRYPGQFIVVQARGIARTLIGMEVGTWAPTTGGAERAGSGIVSALLNLDVAAVRRSLQILVSEQSRLAVALLVWGGGYALALAVLIPIGAFQGWRRGDERLRWLLILAITSAAYLLLSPGAAGEARFRVAAMPLLAWMAGLAWTRPLPPNRPGRRENRDGGTAE